MESEQLELFKVFSPCTVNLACGRDTYWKNNSKVHTDGIPAHSFEPLTIKKHWWSRPVANPRWKVVENERTNPRYDIDVNNS